MCCGKSTLHFWDEYAYTHWVCGDCYKEWKFPKELVRQGVKRISDNPECCGRTMSCIMGGLWFCETCIDLENYDLPRLEPFEVETIQDVNITKTFAYVSAKSLFSLKFDMNFRIPWECCHGPVEIL